MLKRLEGDEIDLLVVIMLKIKTLTHHPVPVNSLFIIPRGVASQKLLAFIFKLVVFSCGLPIERVG